MYWPTGSAPSAPATPNIAARVADLTGQVATQVRGTGPELGNDSWFDIHARANERHRRSTAFSWRPRAVLRRGAVRESPVRRPWA